MSTSRTYKFRRSNLPSLRRHQSRTLHAFPLEHESPAKTPLSISPFPLLSRLTLTQRLSLGLHLATSQLVRNGVAQRLYTSYSSTPAHTSTVLLLYSCSLATLHEDEFTGLPSCNRFYFAFPGYVFDGHFEINTLLRITCFRLSQQTSSSDAYIR